MALKSRQIIHQNRTKISVDGVPMVGQEVGFTPTAEFSVNLGMTGEDTHESTRRTVNKIDVAGNLIFMPSPDEAKILLALILTGTGFSKSSNLNPFTIVIDYGTASGNTVKTYPGCNCNTLEISSEANLPVKFMLEVMGTTESTTGSVGAATNAQPYRDSQVSWDFDGNIYFPESWSLRITRNFSETFAQSQFRERVDQNIFEISGSANFNINDDIWEDIAELQLSNSNGSHELKLDDGVNSLIFTIPEIAFPGPRPVPPSGEDGTAAFTSEIAWVAFKKPLSEIIDVADAP